MAFRHISTTGSSIGGDLSFYEENIGAADDEYDDDTVPSNETEISIVDATSSGPMPQDHFGFSVAAGSGRIVVGAPYDDKPGTGNVQEVQPATAPHLNIGSIRIYDENGSILSIVIPPIDYNPNNFHNTADNRGRHAKYGWSVAAGCDRIIVGAPEDTPETTSSTYATGASYYTDSGAAWILDLDGTIIKQLYAQDHGVTGSSKNDQFGHSVAVGSGRVVVGARYNDGTDSNSTGANASKGSAYIYDLDGQAISYLVGEASDDQFGFSVAVGSGRIVVGAITKNKDNTLTNSGSVYIYDLDGNLITELFASDPASNEEFGRSVAVGSGRIVVGSPFATVSAVANAGEVHIYDLDGTLIKKITATNGGQYALYGWSVAVGSGRIVVGSVWEATTYDVNDDDYAELTAAFPTDFTGTTYVYDLDGNLISRLKPNSLQPAPTATFNGSNFGRDVAIGSGKIVVGAAHHDVVYNSTTVADAGVAFTYDTPDVKHHLDILD